jgi:molybdopterin molybdotransferase
VRAYPSASSEATPVALPAVGDLVSIDAALDAILDRATPVESERVPLRDAHGRVLAESAAAVVDLPPFPSSAMDGFAVRAVDTPGVLPVCGSSAAGRPASAPLGAGEAVAIATGAVVPDGADAVVPIENVRHVGNNVEIDSAVALRANIRLRGGDVREGEQVVPAGARIGAAQIGALAAAGVTELVCARRPRVRVLSTGTELRPVGETLAQGQIYESNAPMIAVALRAVGAIVEILPPAEDEEAATRAAVARGLEADVLVTSGGVSVGTHDLVRGSGRELGVEEVFWGVAMRPGKPLFFGVRASTLVFGLPGNPVSSLVAAMLFVRPAVLALQRATEPGPHWVFGTIGATVRRAPLRDDLLRARSAVAPTGVELTPVTGQESHMITRAALADALVHVPRGEGELPAGSTVRYLRLD